MMTGSKGLGNNAVKARRGSAGFLWFVRAVLVTAGFSLVALVGETGREVYQARLDYDLRRAIVARDGRAAYDLLQKGADSNAQFADSEKPFQWQYRSWPFLRQGSRQPPLRVYPRSQLFMAVFNGDTDMARLLLHAGADPNRVGYRPGRVVDAKFCLLS